MTALTDRLISIADEDELFETFSQWAAERGLELYPAQEEALIEIVSGSNVILSTPTGSGKSLVATGAHFAALAANQRSFYTAPIKALVSEKFFALCDIFGAGERRHDDRRRQRQRQARRSSAAPPRSWPTWRCATARAADVGQVVMDEFHFYAEPDRGWAWQVPLLELPQAQFLLMSATLGDVTCFEEDLTRRTGRPTAVVTSARAPGAAELPVRR